MNAVHAGLRLMMSLLGLAFDEANRLYWRLAELLVFLVLMVPFGLYLNVGGYMEVNIWLSLLLSCATMAAWWYPEHAASIAVLGGVKAKAEGKNVFAGMKEFMDGYWGILKKVLLVETVLFFFLGFIPFAGNPGAFFVIIAGTIAVSLMADQWNFGGGIGKNLAFYGACVIMSFAVISLIPQEFWGGNKSFFGDWATSIKAKKGGIFVLALLLTVILTLFDKRNSVATESKGSYTVIIWILFGLIGFMFMPPAFHKAPQAIQEMWGGHGQHETSHVTASPKAAQVARQPQTLMKPVLAIYGVATQAKDIPAGYQFSSAECPANAFMHIEGPNVPRGLSPIDCSRTMTLTADMLVGARVGFEAINPNETVPVNAWYVKV